MNLNSGKRGKTFPRGKGKSVSITQPHKNQSRFRGGFNENLLTIWFGGRRKGEREKEENLKEKGWKEALELPGQMHLLGKIPPPGGHHKTNPEVGKQGKGNY